MRTYADFARRSPVSEREDGHLTAVRNSPPLVNASLPRGNGLLLHFDGEFASLEALTLATLTGRNFGWLSGRGAAGDGAHRAGGPRGRRHRRARAAVRRLVRARAARNRPHPARRAPAARAVPRRRGARQRRQDREHRRAADLGVRARARVRDRRGGRLRGLPVRQLPRCERPAPLPARRRDGGELQQAPARLAEEAEEPPLRGRRALRPPRPATPLRGRGARRPADLPCRGAQAGREPGRAARRRHRELRDVPSGAALHGLPRPQHRREPARVRCDPRRRELPRPRRSGPRHAQPRSRALAAGHRPAPGPRRSRSGRSRRPGTRSSPISESGTCSRTPTSPSRRIGSSGRSASS